MGLATGLRSLAAISAVMLASWAPQAAAADLGGDCCADLEERIAELEATTARKGNRKVSLSVAGQVNKAILAWDDGQENNVYVVGNKNDQTNLSFTGEAQIAPGWKSGYELTIRFLDTLSDAVNQDDDNGEQGYFLWQSHWFIESEKLGKVSVGLASRVSDTAPETDLSEAGLAGYAGVQDVGGGFALRLADGSLASVGWGDVYNHFNGDTANLVRYDTPEIAGFIASASWGEDDVWDIGLRYSGEGGGFTYEGAIAYTEVSDGADEVIGNTLGIDQSTLVGSVSVLHNPTGLNATFAAGTREWDNSVVDSDGVARTPEDTKFIYAKLGWLAKLNPLGPTAFYGEYGWFKDFISVTNDGGALVGELGGVVGTDRIAGNEAEVWGVGFVQHIEAAEMQVYVGYRHHTADFDLVDGAGDKVTSTGVEDFDTLLTGAKIAF